MTADREAEENAQRDLRIRFATFGEEVSWDKVPELVRAGREVWSFGYGKHESEAEDFTTIEVDDLQYFEWGEAYIADWAPFRVSPVGEEHAMSRFNEDGSWKTKTDPDGDLAEVMGGSVEDVAREALKSQDDLLADMAASHIKGLEDLGYIVIAIAPDEPYCVGQTAEHWVSNPQGPEDPVCGHCSSDFVINFKS